jgi:6-pyruvoyltetrahydropterin/6-carboxytetrahydropterin synthase
LRITRRFRFYAAHRNPALRDKCARLHGHRYGVELTLEFPQRSTGGIGMLFADIDESVSEVFEALDHRTLLAHDDPLAEMGVIDGAVLLPCATSAENLAALLLRRCLARNPHCVSLTLQETDSSLIICSKEDAFSWLDQSIA